LPIICHNHQSRLIAGNDRTRLLVLISANLSTANCRQRRGAYRVNVIVSSWKTPDKRPWLSCLYQLCVRWRRIHCVVTNKEVCSVFSSPQTHMGARRIFPGVGKLEVWGQKFPSSLGSRGGKRRPVLKIMH